MEIQAAECGANSELGAEILIHHHAVLWCRFNTENGRASLLRG